MNSPRWKKIIRDLQSARGRMIMMVVAIAVSIFGVGSILSAYTILNREISQNYLGTNPASAFLELDRVDDALITAVRAQPNIADAEATAARRGDERRGACCCRAPRAVRGRREGASGRRRPRGTA